MPSDRAEAKAVRFLADESCDFAVVRELRAAGHDVVAVTEQSAGISDREVIALARTDERVVLTEDKDFGQLVFAALAGSAGVILIRYPTTVRDDLPATVVRLIETLSSQLRSVFITLTPGRFRISHLPPRDADGPTRSKVPAQPPSNGAPSE